jgi:hypothetical protein
LDYVARATGEISFAEDEIVTIVAEKGNGYFIGCKADGTVGSFPLKYVELEPWPEPGSKPRLMAQMKLLKEEFEEAQQRRTQVQSHVTQLREDKKLLQDEVDPIRFAIRSDQDLVLAVLQTQLKSALMLDSMLLFQSSLRQTAADVTAFRNAADDQELDPLRVDVVERVENLRLKLGIFEQPVADSVDSAQALQREAQDFIDQFAQTFHRQNQNQTLNHIQPQQQSQSPPTLIFQVPSPTSTTTAFSGIVLSSSLALNPRQKRGRMRAEGFSVASVVPPTPGMYDEPSSQIQPQSQYYDNTVPMVDDAAAAGEAAADSDGVSLLVPTQQYPTLPLFPPSATDSNVHPQ